MDINPTFFAAMSIPGLIVAVVLHEIAHGYVAFRLGDPTAKALGRLTLNPIKHVDPFLTIIVPGVLILSGSPIIFGGAKPVPIDPRRLKNPKKDMIWIAAAGPAVNFILAAFSYAVLWGLGSIKFFSGLSPTIGLALFLILGHFVLINVILGLFNLFPVPPLDGGRIAVGILPLKFAKPLARLEPYGLFIVIGCLMLGVFELFLHPVIEFVFERVMLI